jgi:DNA-binding IclR family transcriptional regulator
MVDSAKHPVRAGKRLLEIVEVLEEQQQARVTEIAEQVDFSKSTVHNYLSTLKERGYVIQKGDFYELGLRFLDIGEATRYNTSLYQSGRPQVDRLANEINELVNLVTKENNQAVYIYRKQGTRDVNFSTRVGRRVAMHCTAVGKAMLAHMREEQVEKVIDEEGMPQKTRNTITDRETLHEELAEIRETDIAIDREEFGEGLRCIATPIVKSNNTVLGSISVSAPTTRMKNNEFEEETKESLREAANVVELNIRNY